jgi:hypothetical protein
MPNPDFRKPFSSYFGYLKNSKAFPEMRWKLRRKYAPNEIKI